VVYGPHCNQDKRVFLIELQEIRSAHLGLWIVCGDFNLIYRAADKNNSRLNNSLMSAFCNVLNSMELMELHLPGRLFTWSNEQQNPHSQELTEHLPARRGATCTPTMLYVLCSPPP
jgi:hypothetical protein